MKVKIIGEPGCVNARGLSWQPGKVVDLPDSEAKRLITLGRAYEVKGGEQESEVGKTSD